MSAFIPTAYSMQFSLLTTPPNVSTLKTEFTQRPNCAQNMTIIPGAMWNPVDVSSPGGLSAKIPITSLSAVRWADLAVALSRLADNQIVELFDISHQRWKERL